MNHTTTNWRTMTGAEYDDIRDVPCWVIANGLLVENGDHVGEDHPAIRAEIDRRGRDVYGDHGYGEFRLLPNGQVRRGDGTPVIGCDHTAAEYAHPVDEPCPPACPTRNQEIGDYVTEWARAYDGSIVITAQDVAEMLSMPRDSFASGAIGQIVHDAAARWV